MKRRAVAATPSSTGLSHRPHPVRTPLNRPGMPMRAEPSAHHKPLAFVQELWLRFSARPISAFRHSRRRWGGLRPARVRCPVGFRLRPRSVGKWFLSCSAGTRCARGGLRLLADPLSLIAALHTKGATAPPGVVRVSRSSEESLFDVVPSKRKRANSSFHQ